MLPFSKERNNSLDSLSFSNLNLGNGLEVRKTAAIKGYSKTPTNERLSSGRREIISPKKPLKDKAEP